MEGEIFKVHGSDPDFATKNVLDIGLAFTPELSRELQLYRVSKKLNFLFCLL